eukprot:scaffold1_cov402-Prasinococcus_capsulatus_cf.AAC.57
MAPTSAASQQRLQLGAVPGRGGAARSVLNARAARGAAEVVPQPAASTAATSPRAVGQGGPPGHPQQPNTSLRAGATRCSQQHKQQTPSPTSRNAATAPIPLPREPCAMNAPRENTARAVWLLGIVLCLLRAVAADDKALSKRLPARRDADSGLCCEDLIEDWKDKNGDSCLEYEVSRPALTTCEEILGERRG